MQGGYRIRFGHGPDRVEAENNLDRPRDGEGRNGRPDGNNGFHKMENAGLRLYCRFVILRR